MSWSVVFHEEFEAEFDELSKEVQDELYAEAGFVERFGPETGRPHVDTLKDSNYSNMKELRFTLPDGEWRIAFAFDPKRRAILLVGGSKSGMSEKRFYKDLIRAADTRFTAYLKTL